MRHEGENASCSDLLENRHDVLGDDSAFVDVEVDGDIETGWPASSPATQRVGTMLAKCQLDAGQGPVGFDGDPT
jgi:hypothetical protein